MKKIITSLMSLILVLTLASPFVYASENSEEKNNDFKEISKSTSLRKSSNFSTISLNPSFAGSKWSFGQAINIPLTLHSLGEEDLYSSYSIYIYNESLELLELFYGDFPSGEGTFNITQSWSGYHAPGKYYVAVSPMEGDIEVRYPFYVNDYAPQHIIKTKNSTYSSVNNNFNNPLSAWAYTYATKKEFTFYKATKYTIRLEEMYFGELANAIVYDENMFNDKPTSSQHWLFMKFYLKNNGGGVLEASDIINSLSFYTSNGASLTVAASATLSGNREGQGIYDTTLYSGASGYAWIGILVPKSVTYPYIKIGNGYNEKEYKENISWLNTNPTYTPKTDVSRLTYSKVTNKTYTGKQIKPSITVKNGKKTLKKGTDYTVSYGKNKNTGKATITIKGKGKYTGSKTITFYIVPKKVTISSVKPGKKQLTVKYKKVTGASGYQIAYSTSKSKGFKYITVNSKTASKVIKKLKSKKNYYVKVRAYKSVGKKKYYGAYSKLKSVKVK